MMDLEEVDDLTMVPVEATDLEGMMDPYSTFSVTNLCGRPSSTASRELRMPSIQDVFRQTPESVCSQTNATLHYIMPSNWSAEDPKV
jgi:hypothetical protein